MSQVCGKDTIITSEYVTALGEMRISYPNYHQTFKTENNSESDKNFTAFYIKKIVFENLRIWEDISENILYQTTEYCILIIRSKGFLTQLRN